MIELPPKVSKVPEVTGDSSAVDSFADGLAKVSTAFNDLEQDAASQQVPEWWQGEAAVAYSGKVRVIATDAGTLAVALGAIRGGIYSYSDKLVILQGRQRTLMGARSHFNRRRAQLKAEISEGTASQAQLTERAQDLRRDRRELVGDIAKLLDDEAELNAELAKVLAPYSDLKLAQDTMAGGELALQLIKDLEWILAKNRTPREVNTWWKHLSAEERNRLIATYPAIIGNTPGIPVAARDEANRKQLATDLDRLRHRKEAGLPLTDVEEKALRNAEAVQKVLKGLKEGEGFLYAYEPSKFDGDGAVAIALGDPTTADNVTTLVPGINTEVDKCDTYSSWIKNLKGTADQTSAHRSNSVMLWIGYDAPSGDDIMNTPNDLTAKAGGVLLADHIRGLQALRSDHPHTTIVAHSFGTTTTSHAMTDHLTNGEIDDLVYLGSPGAGIGVTHASELNAPVHAGKDAQDIVPDLSNGNTLSGTLLRAGAMILGRAPGVAVVPTAGLGNDVYSSKFGAEIFNADGGATDIVGSHMGYCDWGSESLKNIATVVAGE